MNEKQVIIIAYKGEFKLHAIDLAMRCFHFGLEEAKALIEDPNGFYVCRPTLHFLRAEFGEDEWEIVDKPAVKNPQNLPAHLLT